MQGGFQLFFEAFDDDNGVSNPDHLDDIFVNRALPTDTSSPLATYSGRRVSVVMSFRVVCDTNFYGDDCSVFCRGQNSSQNGHYTCDKADGSLVCLPNYYGPDCRTFCLACNDEINGFYTCNEDDGSRICNEGFTNPQNFCRDGEFICPPSCSLRT